MIEIHESAQRVVHDFLRAKVRGWSVVRVAASHIPDRDGKVEGRVFVQGLEDGELTDTFVRYRIPASEEAIRRSCVASLERFIPAELRDAQ